MAYICLKAFNLSYDGFTTIPVGEGDVVDVPAKLVDGLTDAGFIIHPDNHPDITAQRQPGPTETKVVVPPETKDGDYPDADDVEADADEFARLRAAYLEATGKDASKRWSLETLRTKLIEA